MAEKQVKANQALAKESKKDKKTPVATSLSKKERRQKARIVHKIAIKGSNNKILYTYSTAGEKDRVLEISRYQDPFNHPAWNKDKQHVVREDNVFVKRFGNLE